MTENQLDSREQKRKVALANLGANSKLPQLAWAYRTHKDAPYGKLGEQAGYALFQDALANDPNIVAGDLLRQDQENGLLYSGNVSSAGIINRAFRIVLDSLVNLKISDYATLVGGLNVGNYGDRVIEDLAKGTEEEKVIAQAIGSHYISTLDQRFMTQALGENTGRIKSGLEELLNPRPAAPVAP